MNGIMQESQLAAPAFSQKHVQLQLETWVWHPSIPRGRKVDTYIGYAMHSLQALIAPILGYFFIFQRFEEIRV